MRALTRPKVFVPILFFIVGLSTPVLVRYWRTRHVAASTERIEDINNLPGLSEGDTAVLPKMQSLAGAPVQLGSDQDEYILLVFFSTQCDGCEKDSPFWVLLGKKAAEKRVRFYLVSIESDGQAVAQFVNRLHLGDLPVIFDKYGEVGIKMNIRMVPQYLLFTKAGKVIGRWRGLSHLNAKHEKVSDPARMFDRVN